MKKNLILATMGCASLLAGSAGANQTFSTAPGAAEPQHGMAVDATATFDITAPNTLQITLTDLLANPTSVGQLISDLDFTLSGGQTSGTPSGTLPTGTSSGQQITVNGNGSSTIGITTDTGWGLNNNVKGGLQLDALGFIGPAGLIIGPPNGLGVYANANGSIAGNGPHNPFINQTATFTLNIPGLTTDETITSVTFSFGTTANDDVNGGSSVPDGGTTLLLLGSAVSGLGLLRRKLS